MTMIPAQDVLHLFDTHMNYGMKPAYQEILNALPKDTPGKHVTTRRNMQRYIQDYRKRQFKQRHYREAASEKELNTIIKISGTTKDKLYKDADIAHMLIYDVKTNQLLKKQFEINTVLINNIPIPKIVIQKQLFTT